MAASSHLVNEKILVTDKEQLIFHLLTRVVDHFNLKTQIRVAGGWVRDKLLGKDSYDMDIALDNLLGKEFCEKINDYYSYTGVERQQFTPITSNPDRSKHLETAKMCIYDISLDFVNLRLEDYSENSRIPSTMRFGTAKEDAFRRDLTINSLFYNIHTASVEDFTQRGLNDLKNGLIVTPLPAKNTFLDDPLRVLRAIRFGARFGFQLDKELKEAAACKDVRDAFMGKISRDRVGREIDLMISGTQPAKAMLFICDMGLFWDVFSLPLNCEPSIIEGCERACATSIDAVSKLMDSIKCCSFTDEEKRLSLYAALFFPLRKTVYRSNTKIKTIHKDKEVEKIPVTGYIFRNSLKLNLNDAEAVMNIHNASRKFLSLIPHLVAGEDIEVAEMLWVGEIIDVPAISKCRLLTGWLLDEIKGLWRVALLMSTLLYPTSIYCSSCLGKRSELFATIEDSIVKMGLDKIWEIKPLVNGKDVMDRLHLEKGETLVGEWKRKLRQWQLANPNGTKEDCLSQIPVSNLNCDNSQRFHSCATYSKSNKKRGKGHFNLYVISLVSLKKFQTKL